MGFLSEVLTPFRHVGKEVGKAVSDAPKDLASGFSGAISDIGSGTFDAIKGIPKFGYDAISELGSETNSLLKNGVKSNELKKFITDAPSDVSRYAKDFGKDISTIPSGIYNDMLSDPNFWRALAAGAAVVGGGAMLAGAAGGAGAGAVGSAGAAGAGGSGFAGMSSMPMASTSSALTGAEAVGGMNLGVGATTIPYGVGAGNTAGISVLGAESAAAGGGYGLGVTGGLGGTGGLVGGTGGAAGFGLTEAGMAGGGMAGTMAPAFAAPAAAPATAAAAPAAAAAAAPDAAGGSWGPYAIAGGTVLSTLFNGLMQMQQAEEQRQQEIRMARAKSNVERAQAENAALDRLIQIWGRR